MYELRVITANRFILFSAFWKIKLLKYLIWVLKCLRIWKLNLQEIMSSND